MKETVSILQNEIHMPFAHDYTTKNDNRPEIYERTPSVHHSVFSLVIRICSAAYRVWTPQHQAQYIVFLNSSKSRPASQIKHDLEAGGYSERRISRNHTICCGCNTGKHMIRKQAAAFPRSFTINRHSSQTIHW
ncbi:MAG: hypothetical protein IKO52_05545 [Clostridia bacterium]|nr:hypothetical protein [Clostridia bacterium]